MTNKKTAALSVFYMMVFLSRTSRACIVILCDLKSNLNFEIIDRKYTIIIQPDGATPNLKVIGVIA